MADEQTLIVGTWKLISVMYEDQETKVLTPLFGDNPRGYQIATADGRWLALATPSDREIPMRDEDRARAFQKMIAYSGRYRIEGNKITTKVDVAWNEAWVGGEQVRYIRFEGDRLFIESAPMPHPNVNNRMVRVIVTWQRDKSGSAAIEK